MEIINNSNLIDLGIWLKKEYGYKFDAEYEIKSYWKIRKETIFILNTSREVLIMSGDQVFKYNLN